MLNNAPVNPTLAVTDINRAREFYGSMLGLKELQMKAPGEEAVGYEAGKGTYLYIYKRPQPSGSTATACSFSVDNVEKAVEDLRKKGIKFEEYDLPNLKTVNGVAQMGSEKAAWFKDPDGNILAIGTHMHK